MSHWEVGPIDSNAVTVTLELDELYGWIRVSVLAGEQRLEFDASYLCDSVTTLITSMLGLMTGRTDACVIWTTERELFEFVFATERERIALCVYTYPAGPGSSREQDGTVAFEAAGARADMIRSFVAAVKTLQGVDDFAARWGHEFPSQDLDAATERLARL